MSFDSLFFIYFILILDLRTSLERSKYPYDSQCFNAMTKSVPPIHYFYYKDNKYFEHFHYVYNLMKDCISRLEKIQGRQEGTSFMSSEVIIKIGIAGYIHEDNLNLIPRTCTVSKISKMLYKTNTCILNLSLFFYCLVFKWMHYL